MLLQDFKTFMHRLFFTKENDLDLGWFFVGLMGLAGCFGFIFEVAKNGHGSVAAWAFLGSAFASVLISAVPIAKARILANSKLPGEIAAAIAQAQTNTFNRQEWADGDPDEGIA